MKPNKSTTTQKRYHDRLARAEGQVRGIGRMIDASDSPMEILTQIEAVKSALAVVSRNLLQDHLVQVLEGPTRIKKEDIEEISRVVRLIMD